MECFLLALDTSLPQLSQQWQGPFPRGLQLIAAVKKISFPTQGFKEAVGEAAKGLHSQSCPEAIQVG